MTREHKLALIVGFSLVLVLGVLISDHFSKARNADLAGDMKAASAREVGSAPPGIALASDSTAPAIPPGQTGPLGQATPESPLPQVQPVPAPAQSPPFTYVNDPAIPRSEVSRTLAEQTQMVPSGAEPLPGLAGRSGSSSEAYPTPVPQQPRMIGSSGAAGASGAPESTVTAGLPASVEPMKRHDLKEGESIYRIAKNAYGDGELWKKLREYNKGKIGEDGAVREGVTIMLPPKDVLLGKAALSDAARANPVPLNVDAGRAAKPAPSKPDSKPEPRPAGKPEPKAIASAGYTTYVVQKGDMLEEVAKRMLGSPKRWTEIVDANKGVIEDPESLAVGTRIRIPSR